MHESRGHLITFAGILALAGTLIVGGHQTALGAPPAEDVACTGCVDTSDIADNAVTGGKIADGTVGSTDIADGAVGSAEIADGGVGSADIADWSVTASKLADDAIFAHVIRVRGDGTPTENCDALRAAIARTVENIDTIHYLIRLDTGEYDCGVSTDGSSLLDVYPRVTLQGAGVLATKITGDYFGICCGQRGMVMLYALTELRDLTVENRTTSDGHTVIGTAGLGANRITNVAVAFTQTPSSALGIFLFTGETTLRDVRIDIPDVPAQITGIHVSYQAVVNLENVTVTTGFTPSITEILSINGYATVRNSVFKGDLAGLNAWAVTVDDGGTADFASTQIDGAVRNVGTGVARCVGSYDGDYVPLPADCGATY